MENRLKTIKDDSKRGLLDKACSKVFGGDPNVFYLYKRTEKLVTAIFLVTGNMSDKDILKSEIRDRSLKMLSVLMSCGSEKSLFKSENEFLLVKYLVEILSRFEISYLTESVSEMNYRILRNEIESLVEDFQNRSFENSGYGFGTAKAVIDMGLDYQKKYLEVKARTEELLRKDVKDSNRKGQYVSDINTSDRKSPFERMGVEDGTKGHSVRSVYTVPKKTGRRDVIINSLKSGVSLGIKDFANIISDCSEKTIQRELLSLVGEGVLKKEGERRWSTYSLVSLKD